MAGLGKIAILGGGSWATALAKIVLCNTEQINWYIRKPEQIEEFRRLGHNPSYITDAHFDTEKITFFSDLNAAVEASDLLIFATPSPFLKQLLEHLTVPLSDKTILTGIKGIVPGENMLVSNYFSKYHNIAPERIACVGGPCHAEEVALERLSYLTIACPDLQLATEIAEAFATPYIRTTPSIDVIGIEVCAILKNVYAIATGICHSLKYGDNFRAVLVASALREMNHLAQKIYPIVRVVNESAYLGDLLVTAYSIFSRNYTFGTMIGRGYSVQAAQMEMGMIAEGYYATKCIHEINEKVDAQIPILDTIYQILYRNADAKRAIHALSYILR